MGRRARPYVPDHGIPGYGGWQLEQVLWFAVGTTFFLPLTLGLPILLGSLVLWRALLDATRRPRLTAYLIAAVVAAAGVLAFRPDALSAIGLVIVPIFIFASLAHPPELVVART